MPGASITTPDQPHVVHQDPQARWRATLEGVLGTPFTTGNRIDRLKNGDQIFPAMLDAIAEAERTIDFLTFVYWKGDIAHRFAHALAAKAAQGVRVRILLDAMGSRLMNPELKQHLRNAGAQVELFRPPTTWKVWQVSHRTHRKLLICDELVAFTGGVGIAEEWEGDAQKAGDWRDSHFRITGPAVNGLRAAFLGNWIETGRHLMDGHDQFPDQPDSGDLMATVVRAHSGHGWNDAALTLESMLHCAKDRVRISTAYFTPDVTLVEDLETAVKRGVQVEVIMPGPHADKRLIDLAGLDECRRLSEGGIELHRFQPTMFHTKGVTIDGVVSMIGSVNLNSRSMRHDDEVAVVVIDEGFTALLDADFDEDLTRCKRFEDDEWSEPTPVQRGVNALTRLVDGWF